MGKTEQWTWKDTAVLFIVPVELGLGWLLNHSAVSDNKFIVVILSFCIFFAGFLTAVLMKKEKLKADFKVFKQEKAKNIIIAIIGAIVLALITVSGRALLVGKASGVGLEASLSLSTMKEMIIPTLLGSIIPVLAPFTEEIIFRYELFYRWRNNRLLLPIMWIVSSVLFGLVHYNNYAGTPIMMVPLMVAGFLTAGLYYWRKTIWVNIFAHFIYNSVLSLIPALLLILIEILK